MGVLIFNRNLISRILFSQSDSNCENKRKQSPRRKKNPAIQYLIESVVRYLISSTVKIVLVECKRFLKRRSLNLYLGSVFCSNGGPPAFTITQKSKASQIYMEIHASNTLHIEWTAIHFHGNPGLKSCRTGMIIIHMHKFLGKWMATQTHKYKHYI